MQFEIRDQVLRLETIGRQMALYSGALALVFPTLHEGFGFPVLEAMRCGTPVITSTTSSLPEALFLPTY